MNKLNFHWFLTNKGGAGKSFSCVRLASYLQYYKNLHIQCYDTDPVNQTLAAFKDLPVKILPLVDKDSFTINSRNFDLLMNKEIPNLSEEISHVLLDIGASSYPTILSYANENPIMLMLQAMGNVFIHASLNGGQAYKDTLNNLELITEQFPFLSLVVWENKHISGKVANAEGVHFLDDPDYKAIVTKACQAYTISIPFLNKETYGVDLEDLGAKNLTIPAALKDSRYDKKLMERQRLLNFERLMNTEIDKAGFLIEEETSE